MSDDDKPAKPPTLTDDDITTIPDPGRRRFLVLGAVGGTAALGGCAAGPTGITDTDTGPRADPSSYGRGTTGRTDSDLGPGSDPPGGGRGMRRGASGLTDRDAGPGADPAGFGRGLARACTDSDTGPFIIDPVGRGRRC
jgi:hypothetical protein